MRMSDWSSDGALPISALWILIANARMQNPVGARFNFETMRMEITDFAAVVFNPVAPSQFVHTVSAGYVTGSVFVLAISAWYLLRCGNLARKSVVSGKSVLVRVKLCGARVLQKK